MATPRREPETAPVPLGHPVAAVIDTHGAITAWSRAAAELLGFGAEEVIGLPARDLLSGHAYGKWHEPHGGAPGGRVLSLRRRDGSRVDVWVRLAPLDGTDTVLALGVPTGELARWADRSAVGRSMLTQNVWQVAVHGPDLRVRHASPAAERGRRRAGDGPDILAHRILLVGEEDATGADVLRQVVETGEPVVDAAGVLRATRRGQSDVYYALSAMPLRDLRGRMSGVLSSMVDVTGRYRSARRADILHRASQITTASLDLERTAQDLVEVLVPALGDLAAVEIADATLAGGEPPPRVHGFRGDFRRIAAKHAEGPWPEDQIGAGQLLPPVPDQPLFRRLEQGEVMVVNDPREYAGLLDHAPQADRLVPRGSNASMVVALIARGRVLGFVQVVRTRSKLPFDDQEANLLKDIVTRAALGIDNARRYTREHRTALTLQNSLLPPGSSSTPAAETAGIYLPAQGAASVGGDWFDAIPLSSLRNALVVGDVIGHGLHASATMARLRTALQTLAELDLGPDEVLTRLDDLVHRMAQEAEEPDTVGASCLYAVYDPVTRRCRVASAGHPAPVAVHPDGTTRLIDVTPGPTLGVGGMPFETAEVELPPETILALYTDGILAPLRDRFPEPERTFAEQLVARRASGLSLREMGARAAEEARAAAESVEDDITLLLARTRAVAASDVAEWEFRSEPSAVGEAREVATAQLAEWGLEELTFVTELVVSELVTNAIRHAEGPVGLRLIRDRVLVCEVSDNSESQPRLRRAHSTDEGGRGLFLVAQVTSRWGSRYDTSGKTIWTEQKLTHD